MLRLWWSARDDHQLMCCLVLGLWVSCVPMAGFAVEQRVCVVLSFLVFITLSRPFLLEGVLKACKTALRREASDCSWGFV